MHVRYTPPVEPAWFIIEVAWFALYFKVSVMHKRINRQYAFLQDLWLHS